MHLPESNAGFLQARGHLTPANDNKWETYHCVLGGDASLLFYTATSTTEVKKTGVFSVQKTKTKASDLTAFTRGPLLSVIGLNGRTLSRVWETKKKPVTPYFFVLQSGGRGSSETIFCTDSQQNLDQWIAAAEMGLYLASPVIFRTSLYIACLRDNCYLPEVISSTASIILKKRSTVGLFRVVSEKDLIETIKKQYDIGEVPDFGGVEPEHLAASVLLTFLGSLKDPVIPPTLELYNAAEEKNEDNRISILVDVVKFLPAENRCVLYNLMQLLNKVASKSSKNKMTAEDLARVFAEPLTIASAPPLFEIPQTSAASLQPISGALETMINQCDRIFSDEDKKLKDKPFLESEAVARRSPNLLRTEIMPIEVFLLNGFEANRMLLWDYYALWRVNLQKGDKLEMRIFVAGRHRFYVFIPNTVKLETDVHYFDILDITSNNKLNVCLLVLNETRGS